MSSRIFSRAAWKRGSTIAVGFAAATAVIFAPTAATAAVYGSYTDTDSIGDMVYYNYDTKAYGASTRYLNDITGTVVVYSNGVVNVKVKFTDLQKVSGESYSVRAHFKSPSGRIDDLEVHVWGNGSWNGFIISDFNNYFEAGYVTYQVNYDKNFVQFSFPRWTIGSPSAIKVNIMSEAYVSSAGRSYFDDAYSNVRNYSNWATDSPWITYQ